MSLENTIQQLMKNAVELPNGYVFFLKDVIGRYGKILTLVDELVAGQVCELPEDQQKIVHDVLRSVGFLYASECDPTELYCAFMKINNYSSIFEYKRKRLDTANEPTKVRKLV